MLVRPEKRMVDASAEDVHGSIYAVNRSNTRRPEKRAVKASAEDGRMEGYIRLTGALIQEDKFVSSTTYLGNIPGSFLGHMSSLCFLPRRSLFLCYSEGSMGYRLERERGQCTNQCSVSEEKTLLRLSLALGCPTLSATLFSFSHLPSLPLFDLVFTFSEII